MLQNLTRVKKSQMMTRKVTMPHLTGKKTGRQRTRMLRDGGGEGKKEAKSIDTLMDRH